MGHGDGAECLEQAMAHPRMVLPSTKPTWRLSVSRGSFVGLRSFCVIRARFGATIHWCRGPLDTASAYGAEGCSAAGVNLAEIRVFLAMATVSDVRAVPIRVRGRGSESGGGGSRPRATAGADFIPVAHLREPHLIVLAARSRHIARVRAAVCIGPR